MGCENNFKSNSLLKTKWCHYYTTGGYFTPLVEHYMCLDFLSKTEVRRYKGNVNGDLLEDLQNGTYQLANNIITFSFPETLLYATWVKGTLTKDIISVEYDFCDTVLFKKK